MRLSEFELLDKGVAVAGEFVTEISQEGKEKIFSLLIYAGYNLSVYSRVEEEIYERIAQLGWTNQGEGDFLRVECRVEKKAQDQNVTLMPSQIIEDPDLIMFESQAEKLQEDIYQILHHELVKPRPRLKLL